MVLAQFETHHSLRLRSNPISLEIALAVTTAAVFVIFIVLKFCCRPNLMVTIDGSGQRTNIVANPSLVETFPVFKYSEVMAQRADTGPLECSVCLCSFEVDDEGQKVRLLPKCNHVFHVGCVDPWLKDHTTCPLCRTNLVPDSNESTQLDSSQVP